MLKMLGLTYYNIKMLKNDFFSSLPKLGGVGGVWQSAMLQQGRGRGVPREGGTAMKQLIGKIVFWGIRHKMFHQRLLFKI